MNKVIIFVLMVLGAGDSGFGQQHTENKADQTLRGSGRINLSTLGMEIDIPLGSYPGRSINVPINLSYSSKVWRMDYTGSSPLINNPQNCNSDHNAIYSENSAAGWTNSLSVPYIEYLGATNLYNSRGHSWSPDECGSSSDQGQYFIKKLVVHLPSGETHELRTDDQVYSRTVGANLLNFFEGVFYAVDSSNIKYIQNSPSGVYMLQMPDGSKYDFAGSIQGDRRKAVKFTDRHGNFTGYDDSTGTWTDTLGRTFTAPFGLNEPAAPTTQTYQLPGMTGSYKFYWKNLKGQTPEESGLTNFNLSLKYPADNALFSPRAAGSYLFGSLPSPIGGKYVSDNLQVFNPVLLTEIEMPNGQKYKFKYNIYGVIEEIHYPTGGKETFQYFWGMESLAGRETDGFSSQLNAGVISRKVYENSAQTNPYTWSYSAASLITPERYRVIINNPDGTKNERLTHRGKDPCNGICEGRFGFENGLAGMPFEENTYNSAGQMLAKKLTNWIKTAYPHAYPEYTKDRHPRILDETSIIYDDGGIGISTTFTYEYEGDMNLRETPVLMKKSSQFAFVTLGSPLPSNPVRVSENTFLINDPNYSGVKSYYTTQNMVGLVTVSKIKDGTGNIVSQSEMVYDESVYSPNIGRGNPTTVKTWDSTKGTLSNPAAYSQTRAKFDDDGNLIESTDAKGTVSRIEYTDNFSDGINRGTNAFPTKTISAVPGGNGSTTPFETTVKYDYTTGLPTSATDANGQTSYMEYNDPLLRPTKVTAPNGHQTITEYGAGTSEWTRWVKVRSQITAATWNEGYAYFDGLGRTVRTQSIDPQGDVYTLTCYDDIGRVSKVTNPFRWYAGQSCSSALEWTTTTYDTAGRPWKITTPDNAIVTTTYDVATSGSQIGTVVTVTDQAGKQRRSITNGIGQLTRVDEPTASGLGPVTGPYQPTSYSYDTLNNLKTVNQGVQTRSFDYDSLSRLTSAYNPESGAVAYQYDNNGNLAVKTDARGVSTHYGYDALNRINRRWYNGSSAVSATTHNSPALPSTIGATNEAQYLYDTGAYGKGHLASSATGYRLNGGTGKWINITLSEYMNRDVMGRPQRLQQWVDSFGSRNYYNVYYQYNLAGGVTGMTYPSGNTVSYSYDSAGRLSSFQGNLGDGTLRTYSDGLQYNAFGAVERERFSGMTSPVYRRTNFNSLGQMTETGLSLDGVNFNGGGRIANNYGTTGNNGNLLSQQIYMADGSSFNQTYAYDPLNRLKSVTEKRNGSGADSFNQTFNYDRWGNRTFDTAATFNAPEPQFDTNQMATANRLYSPGENIYGACTSPSTTTRLMCYDQAGNMIRDKHVSNAGWMTYDAENKMVRHNAGNTLNDPSVYQYDADGRRKESYTDYNGTTRYIHGLGGELIYEYVSFDNWKEYAYRNGDLLVTASNQGDLKWLVKDHLGTPRIVLDKFGNKSRHDYLPFGEEIGNTIGGRTTSYGYPTYPQSDGAKQQFTGYERDNESNLDFAEARMYNFQHGRFTSPDDFRNDTDGNDPQSWNLYIYVRNKPLIFVDPTGKMGDYYEEGTGRWVGSDGIKDDKVYAAKVQKESVDAKGVRSFWFSSTTLLSVTHTEFQARAATAYGESSAFRSGVTTDLANEMMGIAYVNTRNSKAYGATNAQAKAFANTTPEGRTGKMQLANFAVLNQLTGGTDPSNGATMWDGAEQALFSASEKRTSVPAIRPAKGKWELHQNTMGWDISNQDYATWKANVGRGFKAPQNTTAVPGTANAGRTRLHSTAVYGRTIFWRVTP